MLSSKPSVPEAPRNHDLEPALQPIRESRTLGNSDSDDTVVKQATLATQHAHYQALLANINGQKPPEYTGNYELWRIKNGRTVNATLEQLDPAEPPTVGTSARAAIDQSNCFE